METEEWVSCGGGDGDGDGELSDSREFEELGIAYDDEDDESDVEGRERL